MDLGAVGGTPELVLAKAILGTRSGLREVTLALRRTDVGKIFRRQITVIMLLCSLRRRLLLG